MTPLQQYNGALPAGRGFLLVFALQAAGIVTMAFGLLALLGWVFGWPLFVSIGANLIPMAPSTAVLFLLYGAAICLRVRAPLSRRAHWFSEVLVGLGMLVALLLFTLGWLHIPWTGEHLGLNIAGTVDGAQIGHMSLVTAFYFLLAGVSFLASLSPSAIRPWRAALALVSAGVLLGTCFIFLLAYGAGEPLLYGGQFIPPALNTILAFITLGLALMALARRPGGLFRGLPGDDSKPAFIFALIFFVLAMGIVATGYVYYWNYERVFRAEADQQLSAIAELKVGELVQWRKERLSDAAVFHNNPAFTQLVRRSLASPADADAQRQFRAWLGKYQTHFQYDRVFLLDAQGGVRMSVPGSPVPVAAVISARAVEVLRSGQPVFQDFYRHELNQRIYLALLVPVRDEADGNRPLGVLVLRIDPATYLYPFIKRWPVPSETAEMLLIRREGNEAVFLNELRFQTNTALTLRSSLANTDMPAVKAALGQEGLVEGLDYRGVPVLAALRAVPDSPWFLVAHRDVAEVFAPLRTQLWQVTALIVVLLLGAGAGVGLAWRQQRLRFYRGKSELAEALQKSQRLLAQAEELGRVGGWEIDIETRLLTWTKTVYDIHEMDSTGSPTVDQGVNYYTPASRPIIEQAVQRAIEQGEPFDLELEIITAKGNLRSVHAIGAADLARRKVSGFFQDITERKQTEAALMASEIRYHGLFESAKDGILILEAETGMVLDVNPFLIGLLGFSHEQFLGKKIWELGFFKDIIANQDNFSELQRKEYIRYENLALETSDGQRIPVEFISNVSLVNQQKVIQCSIRDITQRKQTEEAQRQSRQAALNMMADAIAARNQSEQMSKALYQSRSAALNMMRDAVAARDRAEQMSQALRASEESYRILFREMQNGFAHIEIICDSQGRPVNSRYLAVNPAFERITGRKAEDVVGKTILEVFPALEPGWLEAFGRVALTGEPAMFEMSAAELGITFSVSAFRPAPNQYAVTFSDITARKQAEEAIRQLNLELEQRIQDRTAQLQAANKELETFTYSVSHDLKAPLRGIDGYSRLLLQEHAERLDAEGRTFLHTIREAAAQMGRLIDDLLAYSRLERRALRTGSVNPRVLVEALLAERSDDLKARNVTTRVAIPFETVTAEAEGLAQAVRNLLDNALKFTQDVAAPCLEIGGRETAQTRILWVRDNGIGFDMRYHDRIYDIFQRLHRAEDYPGTGIGLAIVKKALERMGGRVWAESVPGQGATFYLEVAK